VPLADILLRTSPEGCTTADLILFAREEGILTGKETPKELSGLGHVFRAAGGVNSGETRNSHLDGQRGVSQVVWVRPRRR
jgi:hypothetical protein